METTLAKVIKERGLKKSWIAEQVGISRNTLSLIASGKTEPTLKTARKLSKLLGITIEELWPDEATNNKKEK